MTYQRTDYERMAAVYDSGRALPAQNLEAWRDELHPYLSQRGTTLADVGSGTGLWTEVLAEWFDVRLVAVEPSDGMRRAAAGKERPVNTWLVGGTAEQLPLGTSTCRCAWLSTVLHHIGDLPRCVAELRRVVSSAGFVLIRNSFGDRLDGINWLTFFPTAQRVAGERWPNLKETVETFRAGGFEREAVKRVPEIVATDWRAYVDRIEVRANSTLTVITDEEFEDGLVRLRAAARRETSPREVVDPRDLLVFRKRD
jgi:ubiquinone/menaquinone biosynthesis C-methylase UbiE